MDDSDEELRNVRQRDLRLQLIRKEHHLLPPGRWVQPQSEVATSDSQAKQDERSGPSEPPKLSCGKIIPVAESKTPREEAEPFVEFRYRSLKASKKKIRRARRKRPIAPEVTPERDESLAGTRQAGELAQESDEGELLV